MVSPNKTVVVVYLLFACYIGSVAAQDAADDGRQAYQEAVVALKQFNSKHSRYFRGGRVPIHYLDWPEASRARIPLVFLHGTYSTAHDFVRFAPELIESGFRPVSVDWYGHGRTPIPKEPVSAVDFAVDLKLLLDSLKIDKAVVAGHSRGGVLAGEFYRAFPNRVSGLVLIDGGSTCMSKYFAALGREGVSQWLANRFDERGNVIVPTFVLLEELYLYVSTWERFGKPDDPVEMFDVLSQSAKNNKGRWVRMRQNLLEWMGQDNRENTFNGMLNPSQSTRFYRSTVLFDPFKVYTDLRVPTLILDAVGNGPDYRDFSPVSENEQLKKLHPNLISHIKMPTGHFPHREKPGEFIGHLRRFRKLVR